MSSIVTSNRSTDFTNSEERVLVEGRNVYRLKNHTKFFNNEKQIPHVIHDLVVNKGFVMDKHNQDLVVFKHSVRNDTTYKLYPKELYGEYEQKVLLAELDN